VAQTRGLAPTLLADRSLVLYVRSHDMVVAPASVPFPGRVVDDLWLAHYRVVRGEGHRLCFEAVQDSFYVTLTPEGDDPGVFVGDILYQGNGPWWYTCTHPRIVLLGQARSWEERRRAHSFQSPLDEVAYTICEQQGVWNNYLQTRAGGVDFVPIGGASRNDLHRLAFTRQGTGSRFPATEIDGLVHDPHYFMHTCGTTRLAASNLCLVPGKADPFLATCLRPLVPPDYLVRDIGYADDRVCVLLVQPREWRWSLAWYTYGEGTLTPSVPSSCALPEAQWYWFDPTTELATLVQTTRGGSPHCYLVQATRDHCLLHPCPLPLTVHTTLGAYVGRSGEWWWEHTPGEGTVIYRGKDRWCHFRDSRGRVIRGAPDREVWVFYEGSLYLLRKQAVTAERRETVDIRETAFGDAWSAHAAIDSHPGKHRVPYVLLCVVLCVLVFLLLRCRQCPR